MSKIEKNLIWRWHRFFSLGLILIVISLSLPAFAAEEPAAEGKEVLTRGEALMLISATDFVKKKIGALLSWTVGYDISKVNRVKLTPTINYVRALPKEVPPDGRTIFEITASVDDPGGLKNISGVRADLSSVGRLPNTMLVDNGLFGDAKAEDGIYTLQTSVSNKTEVGPKEVAVAVANKKGWLALAKTSLDVKRDPAVTESGFSPRSVQSGVESVVTLTVTIDNPGRIEDVNKVTVDLRAFGYGELLLFRNDGRGGDRLANDNIFTVQFIVSEFVKRGKYNMRVGVSNLAGGYSSADVVLQVD